MVWETTANQRCTTHFYSTSLWESKGIRVLSARLNTETGIQKQIFLPETLNMFYIQAKNIVGLNNLRMNLIGSYLEMCEQAFLSYTSCVLSVECLLERGSASVYYATVRKFCLFPKNLQGNSKEKRRMVHHKFRQMLETLIILHPQIWEIFLHRKHLKNVSCLLVLLISMLS